MNSRELISKKLSGEKVDIMAKGEFFLEKGLTLQLASNVDKWQAKKDAVKTLGMDYIAQGVDKKLDGRDHWGRLDFGQRGYERPVYASIEDLCTNLKVDHFNYERLSRWKKETDLFIFALIDGPFQTLSSLLDYNQFLMDIMLKKDLMQQGVEVLTKEIIRLVNSALENGADGIIIGEDIAYSKGLIVSPKILRNMFFPRIEEIAGNTSKPVVFHSDGNLTDVLPDIAKTGISGIHSIEEDSNMDIRKVREAVGPEICLLGGFDLKNFYEYDGEELVKKVKQIVDIGKRCDPFIFGTSAGILDDNLPVEKVKIVYQLVNI
ncbi:MAG: hypothetical protein APF76_05855 [Desulfitibacter sp. BRH_c19]|nr:MAG: hypothetical protein APF76_05855 [Desulfitibacter sp. BRH_c19]